MVPSLSVMKSHINDGVLVSLQELFEGHDEASLSRLTDNYWVEEIIRHDSRI